MGDIKKWLKSVVESLFVVVVGLDVPVCLSPFHIGSIKDLVVHFTVDIEYLVNGKTSGYSSMVRHKVASIQSTGEDKANAAANNLAADRP